MIEYIDIHKAFDVPVLTGVNLTVQTGETLSIVIVIESRPFSYSARRVPSRKPQR